MLTGGKKAVHMGDTLYVSPAMWALMKDAAPAELENLLRHIGLVGIPACDFLAPLPLTVTPPGP